VKIKSQKEEEIDSNLTMDQKIVLLMEALTKMKSEHRPRNPKRLSNTLVSLLKLKVDENAKQQVCQELMNELVNRNLIVITEGQVVYLFG